MIDTIFTRAAVAELLADLARPIRPIVEADRRRHTTPPIHVHTHTHTHTHTHIAGATRLVRLWHTAAACGTA